MCALIISFQSINESMADRPGHPRFRGPDRRRYVATMVTARGSHAQLPSLAPSRSAGTILQQDFDHS